MKTNTKHDHIQREGIQKVWDIEKPETTNPTGCLIAFGLQMI